MKKLSYSFCIAMLLSFIAINLQAATGEVTKSGSTWTSKVDGSTVYTGTDMIDAINAACSGTGAGTVNVRSSGDAYAPDGLRSVNILSNQTIDFHGNTMNCYNALNIYPVKGYKRSNVTVKNLKVTGVPRYILHFSGCAGVTISNITAVTTRGTGIRVEYGSNLVINGTIDLHSPGHCIETMVIDGVDIGTVKVQADQGCGVLLNTSENCEIDAIYAYNCDYGQSYAGFRQANTNGTTHLGYLYARHCGRGMYTLTNSHSVTVDEVNIDDCSESGISCATTAKGVRVNSGTVTNSDKNIDIWDGASDICLKVNGGSYGDACNSSSGGSYYSLTNRNSGKCVAVKDGSSSDNANIIQNSCNSSSWSQQFEMTDVGSGYYLIKNHNSGKCLRASGGDVVQYTCNNTYWTEMFSKVDAGSGYYLLKNRDSGTCLRADGTSDGGNIYLSGCSTDYWSEQFAFTSLKSTQETENVLSNVAEKNFSDNTNSYIIYPTMVDNTLNVDFSNGIDSPTVVNLYNSTGKLLLSKNLTNERNNIDVTTLSSGLYIMKISNGKEVATKKIIKN